MDPDLEDGAQGTRVYPPVPCPMDLETAIEEARRALHYFFNNKFDEARKILESCVKYSMYHALGKGVLNFLEAVLTFEQQHFEVASEALKNCIAVCNKYRRKNTVSEYFGKKVNYDTYTPEEIHAELCYAEGLLLKSLLTFIEDETLVSFVKAGIMIRSCFNSYKECSNILRSRNWMNERHKVHFESGVRIGTGGFNLLISLLPPRVIKLFELMGFSGSADIGLQELETGYALSQSIRQIICVMALLGYNLCITYDISHADGDLKFCDEILRGQLEVYPQSVWFLFFKGRLELINGNIDVSINWYNKCWKIQNTWPKFHHLCFWELMWTNSLKQEWREASRFADMLLQQSKWSRTTYSYLKAVMLSMLGDRLSHDEKCNIETLMKNAPQWKQRFAGKSVPMEKFMVRKSERFFAQKGMLVLPAIEILYAWNFFKVLGKKTELIEGVFKLIERTLPELDAQKKVQKFEADNRALVMLLKGASLRQMKFLLHAEESLNSVLALEKQIRDDTYLVPFALVELAQIQWEQRNADKAVRLLEEARKNYTGYSLESRLHFKIHSLETEFMKGKKSPPPPESTSASTSH